MRNFVQPGDTITIPAPHDVKGGEVVIVGELYGIAAGDALSGETMDLVTRGVFDVPKVAADAFAVGDGVYWDAVTKLATADNEAEGTFGAAIAPAPVDGSTVRVRLQF